MVPKGMGVEVGAVVDTGPPGVAVGAPVQVPQEVFAEHASSQWTPLQYNTAVRN